jgi:nitrite reductase/ring-hydroxylating ferredoxin subunit
VRFRKTIVPDSSTAEQPTVNRQVLGSNPSQGAMKLPTGISRRSALRGAITLALAPLTSILGSASSRAAGKKIVKVASLPVGGTFTFTSSIGVPAIVFRTKAGVFAYSMICTHQGCTVTYSKSSKSLICPCHGAKYDPLNGAKVTAGPAPAPLAKVKVVINGAWVVEA